MENQFLCTCYPINMYNGSVGVGTGFSCNIPMFNPSEIIDGLKQWINMREQGEKHVFKYKPWYKGFTGKIEKNGSGRYISYGTLSNEVSNNGMYQYTVSELPIICGQTNLKKCVTNTENLI